MINEDFSSDAVIVVYNTQGQLIYNRIINRTSKGELKTIDISAYSKGIYFLKVNTDNKTYNNKIVIN